MFRKYIDIFNKFIFYTKKCYFFHFLLIGMLPALLFSFIDILFLLHDLYFDYKYDTWGYFETFGEGSGFAFFYCLYCLQTVLIICLILTIISSVLKYWRTRSFHVTSKFLLYNKFYNIIYTLYLIYTVCAGIIFLILYYFE